MLRNWRFWVLAILWVGPPSFFVMLGFRWLAERDLGFWGFLAWVGIGVVASILMVRWTRSKDPILPPIDWDAPKTFTPRDRQAWKMVQQEAEGSETGSMQRLTTIDTYLDVGKRLASAVAKHYHPDSSHPVEHVPVVDILTALELAAEDLGRLCREVPGGDMLTPAHGKRAVQAADYLSRANQIYGYLLPIFQPAAGLARLGASKLMTEPAWRSMQTNLLRWFYRAYVNRLGTHLIELYSGRLAIGADQYRRLTGRSPSRNLGESPDPADRLSIAVVGARGAGRTTLIEAIDAARTGDLQAVHDRLDREGFDETMADLLSEANLIEIEGYTIHPGGEVARDRATRKVAISRASEADLLLLVLDGRREDFTPDVRFAEQWSAWYERQPALEVPPALAILTGIDRQDLTGEPIESPGGGRALLTQSARETAWRAKLEAVRKALPKVIVDVVPVGLGTEPPKGVADRLLPEMAALLHRAERASLIHRFQRHSARSKVRRFLGQVGQQGKQLWKTVRTRKRGRGK